jgi:hypothetical protein
VTWGSCRPSPTSWRRFHEGIALWRFALTHRRLYREICWPWLNEHKGWVAGLDWFRDSSAVSVGKIILTSFLFEQSKPVFLSAIRSLKAGLRSPAFDKLSCVSIRIVNRN